MFLKGTVIAGGLMCFFYWLHNAHCHPYVYSLFSVCEYSLVLFNMGFHGSAYYDFYFSEITVTKSISAKLTTPHSTSTQFNHSSGSDEKERLLESIDV